MATWLCLPFTPPPNLSSWKGASHSLWSKQSLAHLLSLCYNNSLHPQSWETSLQHNRLCCLLLSTTAYKRRDGNCCVTHAITATLQIQPYRSYRGLVVALSPAPAAAAPCCWQLKKSTNCFLKSKRQNTEYLHCRQAQTRCSKHNLWTQSHTCKKKRWAAINLCHNTCQIILSECEFLLKHKWLLICTFSPYQLGS